MHKSAPVFSRAGRLPRTTHPLLLSLVCGLALLLAAVGGPARAETGETFLSTFDDLQSDNWYISNFTIKRPDFRTAWRKTGVTRPEGLDGPVMLSLLPAPPEADKDFLGAEIQHTRTTHYGRYEVVMQAARGEGVISSFFTYTGPHFGDPHDEIDFEFLGRDTTKVWVTRFADGARLPGRWIDLGFDAADGMHLYAFDWLPDRIVWYVDGVEIFRVTSEETTLPVTPGRIYINIWGGGPGQKNWSGNAPDDTQAQALYRCISFRPLGAEGTTCSDIWPEEKAADG